jgi:UDP-N-acetylglucosamine enolpyruvyl transferase
MTPSDAGGLTQMIYTIKRRKERTTAVGARKCSGMAIASRDLMAQMAILLSGLALKRQAPV